MTAPARIQLRRSKGCRMPPNTVKVDRSTKFGNPFVVGVHGTNAYCVRLYEILMSGHLCLSTDNQHEQTRSHKFVSRNHHVLRGKNLACWCRIGTPCHADVLLKIANAADHSFTRRAGDGR